MSEAWLVWRARHGDRNALDRLLRRELPAIRGCLRRVIGADAELDDVTQLALIEIVRSIDTYRGEARLSTWMIRIALRTAWRHIRSRSKVISLAAVADAAAHAASPGRTDSGAELAQMRAVVAGLPVEQRMVFLLRDIEGYTTREIAELLELPQGTVSTRLRAARERIRAHVEGCPSRASADDRLAEVSS